MTRKPERRAALAIKLKFSTERKGNYLFGLSFDVSILCIFIHVLWFYVSIYFLLIFFFEMFLNKKED